MTKVWIVGKPQTRLSLRRHGFPEDREHWLHSGSTLAICFDASLLEEADQWYRYIEEHGRSTYEVLERYLGDMCKHVPNPFFARRNLP
jgi:hypothetical protein